MPIVPISITGIFGQNKRPSGGCFHLGGKIIAFGEKTRQRGLKWLYVFAGDVGKQIIGKTRGSDAEITVVKPLFAEHFFNDGVILERVGCGANATRCFEAHHAATLLIVFLDALAHHIGSLYCGACINLAGRCLDEVSARIHR